MKKIIIAYPNRLGLILAAKTVSMQIPNVANLQPITNQSNVVNQLAQDLYAAIQAQELAKKAYITASDTAKAAQDALRNGFKILALQAQTVTTSENDLIAAGFQLEKQRTPLTNISTPKNVALAEGETGELKLSFEKVKGAKSYVVEYTYDISTGDWEQHSIITTLRNTLKNLTAGQKIWIRVKAITNLGESAYSDVASRYVS